MSRDWILDFLDPAPAASNRIRSEVFFAVTGAAPGLDFVFAEKTLLVACLTYSKPESNRIRIACVSLVPDPERMGSKFAKQDWIRAKKKQSPHTSNIKPALEVGVLEKSRYSASTEYVLV